MSKMSKSAIGRVIVAMSLLSGGAALLLADNDPYTLDDMECDDEGDCEDVSCEMNTGDGECRYCEQLNEGDKWGCLECQGMQCKRSNFRDCQKCYKCTQDPLFEDCSVQGDNCREAGITSTCGTGKVQKQYANCETLGGPS